MQNALLLLTVVADLKIDMKGKSYLETLNFVTVLWLSLECALKITGTEYEILTNMNMMLDYENGVRGGITRVLRHFTKTQNKYVHDYDKSKENTHIPYLDCNNQYGYSLSTKLSYAGKNYAKIC